MVVRHTLDARSTALWALPCPVVALELQRTNGQLLDRAKGGTDRGISIGMDAHRDETSPVTDHLRVHALGRLGQNQIAVGADALCHVAIVPIHPRQRTVAAAGRPWPILAVDTFGP